MSISTSSALSSTKSAASRHLTQLFTPRSTSRRPAFNPCRLTAPRSNGEAFERLATFPVYANNDDPTQQTVAEIVDATPDGTTLVYTDGVRDQVGFVDIADARRRGHGERRRQPHFGVRHRAPRAGRRRHDHRPHRPQRPPERDRHTFAFIERDNLTGEYARFKALTRASLSSGPITRTVQTTFDLLPSMRATHSWITDKPEGLAIARDGRVYVVTDNDGVEDWTGETQLLRLGRAGDVLGGP